MIFALNNPKIILNKLLHPASSFTKPKIIPKKTTKDTPESSASKINSTGNIAVCQYGRAPTTPKSEPPQTGINIAKGKPTNNNLAAFCPALENINKACKAKRRKYAVKSQ